MFMTHIHKLLFPVDGSASSLGAVKHVQVFADHFKAETIFLHAAGTEEKQASQHEMSAAKARIAELFVGEIPALNAEIVCTPGDPAASIREVAHSWKPDLVMMPTRGRGEYRRHLLGSVTAKVLCDLDCPVWTSVHAENALAADQIEYRRILCAVDMLEHSQHVLAWAKWLADEYGSSLGIVHAMATVDPSFLPGHIDPPLGELGSGYGLYMTERAEQGLAALQAELGSIGEVFVVPGSPISAVPEVASRFNADLAVIGRRSGGAISHDVFHDVSAILRSMPCPVISI
jgi:nucleotide-binding universal stress UspA family protein